MRVAYLQALPNQLFSCCFKPTEKPLNANTYKAIDKAESEEKEEKRKRHCYACDRGEVGKGQEMCPTAVARSLSSCA